MGYFLRKDKKKNGLYLQMYETYWDKNLKQARTKCIESFGYVSDLTTEDCPEPISFYKNLVYEKEQQRLASVSSESRPRAFEGPVEKNVGYFLIDALMDKLQIKNTVEILASVRQFQFSLYDMLRQLICSRIIEPCSKSKTTSNVFPMMFGSMKVSEDQVYDACEFIGESYQKYVDLFNIHYGRLFRRNYDRAFFDCTNYYFEIDAPKGDQQKGPSKENRHDPIIGQALLLDADLVPVGMRMYPGNESEKPYIRKMIEDMKSRCKVTGKTVQIADKGLNCARNIYAAVKEADDGYIFSKSVHGRNLSRQEKEWVLLEDNLENRYENHFDKSGRLAYRLKSCTDTFEYSFKEADPQTGEIVTKDFSVREKRIVSFNPSLAKKQKAEIMKQIEKASSFRSRKDIAREELGDAAKYISVVTKDAKGKTIAPVITLNTEKINEDLRFAGYNLIVTSEVNMTAEEIYEAYHGLWKIEECFRLTKSYLDARPVFVQKPDTIYGHFLICYLSLFLLRVLEIRYFRNEVSSYDLISFIRDFRVAKTSDNTYINLSRNQKVNEKIKKATGLNNLDALYLTESEIRDIFRYALPE